MEEVRDPKPDLLLRTQPALPHDATLAPAAGGLRLLAVQAVVAHQPLGGAVVGEGDGTVGTGRDVAAGGALHEGGVSAAVEEEDGLLAGA